MSIHLGGSFDYDFTYEEKPKKTMCCSILPNGLNLATKKKFDK
jgi:hypothetical protein